MVLIEVMNGYPESVGSTSAISHQNREPIKTPETAPGLSPTRSVERGLCFSCKKTGHWVKDCPAKTSGSKSQPSVSREVNGCDYPEIQCRCGAGACSILTSRTEKNPNRQFYSCPISGSGKCSFFKWRDTLTSDRSPNLDNSPYPECSCGAGKSKLLIEKNGINAGRKYFICPVKKGQGACDFYQAVGDLEVSDTRELSEHNEQGELRHTTLLSGPSEDCRVDVAIGGLSVCNAETLSQFSEPMELKGTSSSSMLFEGESPDQGDFNVQSGSVDCKFDEAIRDLRVLDDRGKGDIQAQGDLDVKSGSVVMVKEYSGSPKHHQMEPKGKCLTWLLGVGILCVLFYALGDWENASPSASEHSEIINKVACDASSPKTNSHSRLPSAVSLDFQAHHQDSQGDGGTRDLLVFNTGALSHSSEQMESRDISSLKPVSKGETRDREAPADHLGMQSGPLDADSLASSAMSPPCLEGDEDYMSDILSSTAHHFANRFLQHVQGLSIQSLLGQRSQLVEAARRISDFGVDCSAFVSQIQNLINQMDEFEALSGSSTNGSLLAEQVATIQQVKDQLRLIDSENTCQRERLNDVQGRLLILVQAEDALVAERTEVLKTLATITEELQRVESEHQQLNSELAAVDEEVARSQRLRAELQEQLEQAEQEYAKKLALVKSSFAQKASLRYLHL